MDNFNSWSIEYSPPKITEATLKREFSFLSESISYALQQKRIDFDATKNQFFSSTRKVKLGRMKFKCKGTAKDSFRIPGQALNRNKGVKLDNQTLNLPKMDPIKMIVDRRFNGEVRSVTVSRNKSDQYLVSVLVKDDIKLKLQTKRSVGIDLGLAHLAILSNGMKIDNPKWFRESQSKLRKYQKHFSRKFKGSKRREKARLEVARIYQKITNQRDWYLHNITSWLVENYDIISIENLNIKGMLKNKKLSKSSSDASWAKFISMLEYKCNWYGKTLVKIDRWFPSSKTCSSCGTKIELLPLNVREWECVCGAVHDRDVNAANNILTEGLKELYNITSAELVDYRHGEKLSLLTKLHSNIAFSVKC